MTAKKKVEKKQVELAIQKEELAVPKDREAIRKAEPRIKEQEFALKKHTKKSDHNLDTFYIAFRDTSGDPTELHYYFIPDPGNTTVHHIKRMHNARFMNRKPPKQQLLLFRGNVLENRKTLLE